MCIRAACSLHHDNGCLATDDLNTNSQLHAARFRVAKKFYVTARWKSIIHVKEQCDLKVYTEYLNLKCLNA